MGGSPGNTVHATGSQVRLRHGGVLKVVRWSGPSGHIMGVGGFWGPSCAVALAASARRNQAKTNRSSSSLAHSHTPKTPSGKEGLPFFFFQKRPFEINHRL